MIESDSTASCTTGKEVEAGVAGEGEKEEDIGNEVRPEDEG